MTAGCSGTRAALAVTRSATCVPSTVLLGSPAAREAPRQSRTPLRTGRPAHRPRSGDPTRAPGWRSPRVSSRSP